MNFRNISSWCIRNPVGPIVLFVGLMLAGIIAFARMVHKKANWVLKLAGLDEKLADAIIDGLRKLSVEMSTDPAHPVRQKVEEALAQLANDLQTRPETRAKVEEMKEQLLANRSVALWIDTLWQKGRESIIRAARNPDAAMAGRLGEVLKSMSGVATMRPWLPAVAVTKSKLASTAWTPSGTFTWKA